MPESLLTDGDLEAIVHHPRLQSHLKHAVEHEVTVQLRGINSRLTAIEQQTGSNGRQTEDGRREVAQLGGMLTAWFGPDGTSGSIGILLKNSSQDSRRANDLAHKINGHLEILIGRGWLEKNLAEESAVKHEKKVERNSGWIRWAIGAVAAAVPVVIQAARHWATRHLTIK